MKTGSGRLSFKRLSGIAKLLINGRPACFELVSSIVREKRGIEIGGPSAVFRRTINLPIYNEIFSLDNCDFSRNTEWADHNQSYCFSNRRACGQTFFCEGSNLGEIPDSHYDFLLSSHNLEHLANPIKGLMEWKRVVKPKGHFIIVLPHYAKTFDHRRVPTEVSHMKEDYEKDIGEDDLTHVEEIFQAHRLNDTSRPDEELRNLLLTNYHHRMMHHHVFDEVNSKALLETVGLNVLAVELQLPFHIFLVAQVL